MQQTQDFAKCDTGNVKIYGNTLIIQKYFGTPLKCGKKFSYPMKMWQNILVPPLDSLRPGSVLTNRHQGILPWQSMTENPPAAVRRALHSGLILLEAFFSLQTFFSLPLVVTPRVFKNKWQRDKLLPRRMTTLFTKEGKLPTPMNYIIVIIPRRFL